VRFELTQRALGQRIAGIGEDPTDETMLQRLCRLDHVVVERDDRLPRGHDGVIKPGGVMAPHAAFVEQRGEAGNPPDNGGDGARELGRSRRRSDRIKVPAR